MKKSTAQRAFTLLAKIKLKNADKALRMQVTRNVVNLLPIIESIEKGLKEAQKRFFPDDLQKQMQEYNDKVQARDACKNESEKAILDAEVKNMFNKFMPAKVAAENEYNEFAIGYLGESVKVSVVKLNEDALYSALNDSGIDYTALDAAALDEFVEKK